MKSFEEFLLESNNILWHCTLTANVSKIKSKGIAPLQTSNWATGSGKRYGGGYIFAFNNFKDAVRWASKWDWDITSSWGSGKISIIEFTDNIDSWEIDDADPISQMGNNGDWLKKKESVSPKSIKNIQIFTKDLLK